AVAAGDLRRHPTRRRALREDRRGPAVGERAGRRRPRPHALVRDVRGGPVVLAVRLHAGGTARRGEPHSGVALACPTPALVAGRRRNHGGLRGVQLRLLRAPDADAAERGGRLGAGAGGGGRGLVDVAESSAAAAGGLRLVVRAEGAVAAGAGRHGPRSIVRARRSARAAIAEHSTVSAVRV